MKKHFYSISYKLLLTLVAGTTIPMLIYCLFFYFDMRRSSENAYVTQARQTWRIVSNNIEHSLSTSIYAANQGIYLNGIPARTVAGAGRPDGPTSRSPSGPFLGNLRRLPPGDGRS